MLTVKQGVDTPGFYTPENYERAVVFLEWMTHRIHSNTNYRTTGVLGVMNEPVHASDYPDEAADMLENFYPAAYTRIRAMERSLGVRPRHHLKIQYMGWGTHGALATQHLSCRQMQQVSSSTTIATTNGIQTWSKRRKVMCLLPVAMTEAAIP